uniref:Integrase zinc-binding domain-containing protein n=1 Tax=Cajanus cajan TaxID=3821 RepID=A0A151RM70_CAJCA|nr:hypothetical protein KK1_034895 [Cajanus cajan]
MDQENRIIQPYQEENERINLGQGEDKKEISINTKIKEEVRDQLIGLLKEYVNIFSWSYHDMSALDREIVKHKLPIKDEIPPIKQGPMTQFESINFEYTPREGNKLADALATLSSMFSIKEGYEMPIIRIRRHETQAHYCALEEKDDDHPWYFDIQQYIKEGKYPVRASNNDKKMIRRRVVGFTLHEGILYKKSFDSVLLRCVFQEESQSLMKGIHEGTFGTHVTGQVMARKIMRVGYFWSTMEKDCISYARKCHKCQIYADNIQVPPSELNVMASP